MGLTWGIALGFTLGSLRGLIVETPESITLPKVPSRAIIITLILGLSSGLLFMLFFSLVEGFGIEIVSESFGVGIGLSLGFYFCMLRMYLYPFQFLGKRELMYNPYLKDVGIFFPCLFVDKSLVRKAQENPALGRELAAFLLAYRPLQVQLAYRLLHTITASQWQAHFPTAHALRIPEITTQKGRYDYPEQWKQLIAQAKEQLREAESLESTPRAQLHAWERFLDTWQDFEILVRQPVPKGWNRYYLDTVILWREQTEEKIGELREEVKRRNPIADPIYKPGQALNPSLPEDRSLFFGRQDLKEQLINRLYSTSYFPLFLVQGQRRVGKTSFLRFLPSLMGSGYQVINIDIQGKVRTISDWLRLIDQELNYLRKKEEETSKEAPSIPTWQEIEERLLSVSQQLDKRILLAFDEYEYLQDALREEPEEADFLLGAMRNFSQRQSQVLFLFSGSAFLSELRKPDWNHYFVQTELLKIDYLSEEHVNDLLNLVPLTYTEDLRKSCFEATQGHPSLMQLICSELVEIANREQRKELDMDDLTHILQQIPKETDLAPAERFWEEVCGERYDPKAQEAIRLLLNDATAEELSPFNLSLIRLENHGFLIPDGHRWRFRVPLIEQWVRRNALGQRLV